MKRKSKYFTVTHNERYSNFLISPKFLFEDALKFVYKENNTTVEKVVPLKKIAPYLKSRRFFKYDSNIDRYDFNGWSYEIPAHVIFSL